MLAIFFYSVASLLLPVIIINAKEPVMDFSQLVPPTTTTFPPAPVPAAGVVRASSSSSSGPQDMNNIVFVAPLSSKFRSFLDHIIPTKNSRSPSFFSISSYRPRLWRSSPKRSTSTSYKAATKRVAGQDGWEVEEKPYKSRYSPRAASSVEEYDAYGFRQNTSYNKSGSCSSIDQPEKSQQQHQQQQRQQQHQNQQQPNDDHFQIPDLDVWRAPMQHIGLPVKP